MRQVLLIALIGFAVSLAVLPSHAEHRVACVLGDGTCSNVAPLTAPGPASGPLAGNPTLQLSQDKPIPPAPASDLLVEDVPLPGNVSVSNPQNIPENFKRFSGAWVGAWVGAFSGQLHHILIVESVMADGNANVVYASGDSANVRRQWYRYHATIVGNTLRVERFDTLRVERFATYELTRDGKLDATFEGGDFIARPRATMSRIELTDFTRPGKTIAWTSEAPAGDLLVEDVPLPGNVSVSNPQNIPENFKRFSGAWVGAFSGQLHHILIVESVMADGNANVVYASGDYPAANMRRQWYRYHATIVGNTLRVERLVLLSPETASLGATYELTGDGKLDATFDEAGNFFARPRATMSRIELADLTRPGKTIAWTSEFLGTALKENGKSIRPEKSAIPMIGHLALESNPIERASFRQDLQEAGFIDGRDVRIEFRSADKQDVRLPELAADLVRSQAAIIVAVGGPAIYAAKIATATIPIVFMDAGDPIEFGLVASLNRPGGNITGVALIGSELVGKQLDLLHQMAPRAAPFGYLSQFGVLTSEEMTRDIVEASRALGTELVVAEARSRSDIETAFATFAQRGTGGLVVGPYALFDLNYSRVLELAARNKIPAMYSSPYWVRGGGLVSYSASFEGGRKVVVDYVARILRGAKPADLPVQRPTAFDLVINLKTAGALGLRVPPSLLALADEVIDYEPWNIAPTITVVSAADDPRLPLVSEAVAFWNDTFAELGTSFRLGPLTQIIGAIPAHDLTMLNTNYVGLPDSLNRIAGNIVVVLSEGEFISFTARRPALNKVVVAIKDYRSPPLTLPNVTRNLIAHLLGLAMGLSHNADPTTLMCGRPAPCRPNLFASDRPRYFPLTEAEKAELREMYPSSWRASR